MGNEVNQQCQYCKEPHGNFLTDGLFDQCRVETFRQFETGKKRVFLCVNNSAWTDINFCPICGREFAKEDAYGNPN